jgi:phage terminase large subunit GpA-like protein
VTIQLANAARLALEAAATAWAPPPPVDLNSWAEDNIAFTERESPFPGRYNADLFPFFTEILRALGPDDPCRTVSFVKSAQLGGTVLANIFLLGTSDLDPGDFLYVHPTEDNARRWSKLKLAPMLKSSTALRRLFPEKSRDGADSLLYKERADGRGSILVSGANSPSSLSQVSMRRQVQDDLAKWEMNAAGDPEMQADSRSQAFEFAKIYKASTPLVLPGCRITRNYEAGSRERFHVPCPHCGTMQPLEWPQFRVDEEQPERSAFLCSAADCGGLIEEHHRPAILRRGTWVAENPAAAREHRSFHLWSAYSRLQSFERIARGFLKSRGEPEAEKTFWNDVLGLAYQVKGEAPPWEALRDRADAHGHRRATIPAWCLVVTVGVDCQGDRVEWQALGWSRDGRRAVIDAGVIDGHISEDACRQRLDRLVATTWRHGSGRDLGIDMLAIDGNAFTEDVWDWARRHPASRVIMVRGVDSEAAPLIAKVKRERNPKTGKVLKYSSRFYHFATSVLKMALYRNLPKTDPQERGFVQFPQKLDDEYFRQLTSERRIEKKTRRGFIVHEWVKDSGQANEMLDTHLQAEAAAIRYGIRSMPDARWDFLESERAMPPAGAQIDLEDLLLGGGPASAPTPPAAKPAAPAAPTPATATAERATGTSLADRLARLNRPGE